VSALLKKKKKMDTLKSPTRKDEKKKERGDFPDREETSQKKTIANAVQNE
jgi:hypothetical protein